MGSAPAIEPDAYEPSSVSEEEVARAFFWIYKAFCRLLRSDVPATLGDFEDAARAWAFLLRRFRYAKTILNAIGPIVSTISLLDKIVLAWEVRERFRPKPKGSAGVEVPSSLQKWAPSWFNKKPDNHQDAGQVGVEIPGQPANVNGAAGAA